MTAAFLLEAFFSPTFYGHSGETRLSCFPLNSPLWLLLMENVSWQLLSALASTSHHQWLNWASQPSPCRNFSSCLPQEIAGNHAGLVLLTFDVQCAAHWVMWCRHPSLQCLCACHWCNWGLIQLVAVLVYT